MKQITKALTAAILILTGTIFLSLDTIKKTSEITLADKTSSTKIQVAILLDVSNSMDGLIEQAKAQLWNMVNVMGKAEGTNNQSPEIEIALYEYGRTTNDSKQGYIKQINGFIKDLDDLSKNLFKLTTNGGDEYCTNVIYTSLNELTWDVAATNYKVIFIAGNEDFLQGDVSFSKACEEAKKKGVIINTIYCGDRNQGLKEHWNLPECGNGSFTNINQDAKIQDIPTPFDSMIITLNDQLNKTYVAYGAAGAASFEKQGEVDKLNYSSNKSAMLKRAAVKGQSKLYRNSGWDLVDAFDDDSSFIAKVDLKTLTGELKNKSRADLLKYVTEKKNQRGNIQKNIAELNTKRESFLAAERARAATNKSEATLESEVERIIKQQARLYNLTIK